MKCTVWMKHPKWTYPNIRADCAKLFAFAHLVTHLNSLGSSSQFSYVAIRGCRVRVSTLSCIYEIKLCPPALHIHPWGSCPAGNWWALGTERGWDGEHSFVSMWFWANYSEPRLSLGTLELGIPASQGCWEKWMGSCMCLTVRVG